MLNTARTIDQQRYHAQQDDGRNEALLQCELSFHDVSSHRNGIDALTAAVTPSTMWSAGPEGTRRRDFPRAQLAANSATGSQNLPPTRWSWENSDWPAERDGGRRLPTSGKAAALALAGALSPQLQAEGRWCPR